MTLPEPSLLASDLIPGEELQDFSLRPERLNDYVGQKQLKEAMSIAIGSAKQRGAALDHVLLYGPPGLGKTSLAHILAREMGCSLRVTSGPAITKVGDLAAMLTGLQPGDILFIDEIHRLQRSLEETLYAAMEDRALDILLGKGPSARSIRLELPAFTLVGATTRAGALSQPLRDRFGHVHRLDYYEPGELEQIIRASAGRLELEIEPAAIAHIATRARRTPRVANRLLRRVRDYALVMGNGRLDLPTAQAALDQLGIDPFGLDLADRLILETMERQFGGGPVGLETLASATGEDGLTIEDAIEPYLMRIGFLERTPRGRIVTEAARRHLGSRRTLG